MHKSGQPWDILEICRLYTLIKWGNVTLEKAEEIMGRSALAFQYKVIKGGLFDEDLNPATPFPDQLSFIKTLKKTRQFQLPDIPPDLQAGKLTKIFKRTAKNYESVWSIADNRRHLIPKMSKWACRDKYKGKKEWWRFAGDAQSNPFMRSQTYKKDDGKCALCSNPLSEGEYQAHHSCYDHVCTYKKSIFFIDSKGIKKSIPDCQSCATVNPEKFSECYSRLHAVHGACNKRLFELEEK